MTRLQPDPSKTSPAGSSEDKEKELRRVYRKLKGVRSQLSVKIRELRKEIAEERHVEEECDISEERFEAVPTGDHTSTEHTDQEREESREKGSSHIMQFEVKALVDHKRRLRKRFWRLQAEARRNK